MKQLLLVGFGGFLGSVLRYLISKLNTSIAFFHIPLGTLLVNVLGSLLIGFFIGMFLNDVKHSDIKYFLVTGFCGGFTTFSTFSSENLSLMQNGHTMLAVLYAVLSIGLGVFAVFVGYGLSHLVKS